MTYWLPSWFLGSFVSWLHVCHRSCHKNCPILHLSLHKLPCWLQLQGIHVEQVWKTEVDQFHRFTFSAWTALEAGSSSARARATPSGSRPGRCSESRLPAPGLPTSLPSLPASKDNPLTFPSIADHQVQHSEGLLLPPPHPGQPALPGNHHSPLHSQSSGSLQVGKYHLWEIAA